MRTSHAAAVGAAACVLVCVVVSLRSSGGRGRSLLQYPGKGGGLYGFQRDETSVNEAERRRAMDTLVRAAGSGVHLLTAKDAADEQLRWLQPFYKRQMHAAERVWGSGPVASAVDIEGRAVHYRAVNADKQSAWAKAAMGSRTVPLDAQVVPPSQAREKSDAEAVDRAPEDKAATTEQLAQQTIPLDSLHVRTISPLTLLQRGLQTRQRSISIDRSLASSRSVAANMQHLAEIYGVRISDSDAWKFFGKDYEKKYKPPSKSELHDYIQYLADHPLPKPANATEDEPPAEEEGEEEECADDDTECENAKNKDPWPQKPKFGKKFKTHSATQWCSWPGGEEEVPCQIGANGAYYDEPFSAGLWARHTPNRETLVANGVWRFPGAKPPKARQLFPAQLLNPNPKP